MLILIRQGVLILAVPFFFFIASAAASSKSDNHSQPASSHAVPSKVESHSQPASSDAASPKHESHSSPASGHAVSPKRESHSKPASRHAVSSKVAGPAKSHPVKTDQPEVKTDQNIDLSYFSTIPPVAQKTFQLILDARRPENLQQAILKTEQLMQRKGVIGETASFLMGDLYLRQADGGDPRRIDDALRAFGKAVRQYPNSENVPKALLKKADIYFSRNLYPEALGNYQRASHASDKRYAGLAYVGMARSFQAWRRWNEALGAVTKSADLPLSPENRKIMGLIRADAIYQRGRFEEAFQAFKALLPKNHPLPKDPTSLFGYAESAYRTGRSDEMGAEMKELLKEAYLADTQGPVAPLALARLHTLLKREGETEGAQRAADTVYAMMPHVQAVRAGKVMIATANLAALACPNPCTTSEAVLNLEQLVKVTKSLVTGRPFSITSQGAAFDGLAQLQRYQRFDQAEEVYPLLLFALPSASVSPYTLPARGRFRQTVLDHFEAKADPKVRTRLHRRFWWAFEDRMAEETGLKIAKAYIQLEDFSTALNLLHPIAQNTVSVASQEALYQRAVLLAKIREYKESAKAFVEYRVRYPDQYAVLVEMGEVYDHLELFESSSLAYEMWLQHYPDDKKRLQVYQKLSDAYQRMHDLPKQIRTYQAWIPEIPEEANRPYMALAEAYHQQGEIKEAIRYYERALTFEKDQKEMDWGLLHLADAYLTDGQIKQAGAIFKEVQKRAKNPLIKKIAIEKERALKPPSVKGS